MVGLRTTRVIIIDDDEKDALGIVRALRKTHIAALYFKDKDDVPSSENRLVGVRLAFLDMDIIGGGASPRNKAAALANMVRNIIHPENGPYAAVAWTGHQELVSEFERYVYSRNEIPKPISIIPLLKEGCKVEGQEEYDLAKVATEIEKRLDEFSPLLFLQTWEERSFRAASDVVHSLSNLAVSSDTTSTEWLSNWRKSLLKIVHAMAVANRGKKNVKTGAAALSAFYDALNPLHADQLENYIPDLCEELDAKSSELLEKDSKESPDIASKSQINTMLHCSNERVDTLSPGNVYSCTDSSIEPLFNAEAVEELVGTYVSGDPNSEKVKRAAKQLGEQSIPILVEMNALCDHAQKKVKRARLIAGLLIPQEEFDKDRGKESSQDGTIKKGATFLWHFGPVAIPDDNGTTKDHYIVLNALYVIGAGLDDIGKAKASIRLRTQALVDLQTWFGNHATRPGTMLLRVED